jgi:hypothetical protein
MRASELLHASSFHLAKPPIRTAEDDPFFQSAARALESRSAMIRLMNDKCATATKVCASRATVMRPLR